MGRKNTPPPFLTRAVEELSMRSTAEVTSIFEKMVKDGVIPGEPALPAAMGRFGTIIHCPGTDYYAMVVVAPEKFPNLSRLSDRITTIALDDQTVGGYKAGDLMEIYVILLKHWEVVETL